jgi:predicted ArsR family transcriptional regulator
MQAALKAGSHNTMWSRAENGVIPAPETLAEFARAVGIGPDELEAVGQTEAAALLAERIARTQLRAVENDGSSPEGRMEALIRAQAYLTDHGWAVSLRRLDDKGFVLQVSPQGSLRLLTCSHLTHNRQRTHLGNTLAK